MLESIEVSLLRTGRPANDDDDFDNREEDFRPNDNWELRVVDSSVLCVVINLTIGLTLVLSKLCSSESRYEDELEFDEELELLPPIDFTKLLLSTSVRTPQFDRWLPARTPCSSSP